MKTHSFYYMMFLLWYQKSPNPSISWSIHLLIHPSHNPSVYWSIHLLIHPSDPYISWSIHLLIYLSIDLSYNWSTLLLSIYVSIHPSFYLSIYLFISSIMCLFMYWSTLLYFSIFLLICPTIDWLVFILFYTSHYTHTHTPMHTHTHVHLCKKSIRTC